MGDAVRAWSRVRWVGVATLSLLAGCGAPSVEPALDGSVGLPSRDAAVDASQVDASQVDASQVDASQVDPSQVDASQVDASQVDASQVDAGGVVEPANDCRTTFALARCCPPGGGWGAGAGCDAATGAYTCALGAATVTFLEPWEGCGPSVVTTTDVEIGVPCAVGSEATACTPPNACVESISTVCEVPSAGTAHYRLRACDGPEDCDAGACCLIDERARPLDDRAFYRTECRSTCAEATARLCNADEDCGDGEACCAGRGPSRFGVCRASCTE